MSLSRRAEAADTVAFDQVVREHTGLVYGVVLRILGDVDRATEVTNTAFLKAYRSFARYDRSRPLRAWLAAIAANEAISAGRAATRERAHRAELDEAAVLPDRAAALDDAQLAREERERVRRAVAALPELYRVPIVLRYFGELSTQEVAEALGRPATTIGAQLLRGRALLRASLRPLEGSS